MKLIILILVNVILSSHSCNNECDKNLKDAISKNWTYDSQQKFYKTSLEFTKQIDSVYKGCIIGKDSAYISKLFGSDYTVQATEQPELIKTYPITMQYIVFHSCDMSAPNARCFHLVFYLTNESKVGKASLHQESKSSYQ